MRRRETRGLPAVRATQLGTRGSVAAGYHKVWSGSCLNERRPTFSWPGSFFSRCRGPNKPRRRPGAVPDTARVRTGYLCWPAAWRRQRGDGRAQQQPVPRERAAADADSGQRLSESCVTVPWIWLLRKSAAVMGRRRVVGHDGLQVLVVRSGAHMAPSCHSASVTQRGPEARYLPAACEYEYGVHP